MNTSLIFMWRVLVVAVCAVFLTGFAKAPDTKVTIRALAKDAKFIGTGIGGAYVIVRDHHTQEVLDKGYTTGTSGDTKVIVTDPKSRYGSITDDNTARFIANLAIQEPTFVDVEVIAPFNRKHAAVKSSTQIWVIPGKDISGDGVILEIPGFIVDILSPTTHEVVTFSANEPKEVTARISLVLMCGCTVQEGGIWDSRNYEVAAIVRKDGIDMGVIDLVKTSEDNIFEAKIPVPEYGNYELIVTAFDTKAKNTGVDKISFVVQ